MTTSINLIINYEPSYPEASVAMDRHDGGIARITAIVDTGARTSLFPSYLLDMIPHQIIRRIEIKQAGIALQVFEGVEARVNLWLEDRQGNRTSPLQAVVWFADTIQPLVGFKDILNHAVLHLDMPQRSGYLQFPD